LPPHLVHSIYIRRLCIFTLLSTTLELGFLYKSKRAVYGVLTFDKWTYFLLFFLPSWISLLSSFLTWSIAWLQFCYNNSALSHVRYWFLICVDYICLTIICLWNNARVEQEKLCLPRYVNVLCCFWGQAICVLLRWYK